MCNHNRGHLHRTVIVTVAKIACLILSRKEGGKYLKNVRHILVSNIISESKILKKNVYDMDP